MTVAVVVFVLVVVVVGVVVVAVVPMAVVRFVVVELAVVVLVVVVVAVVVGVNSVVVNVVCKVVVVEYRLASVEGRQEAAVYRQVEVVDKLVVVERSQNVVVVAVVGVGNILIQRHSLAGVDNGFDHRRVLIIVLRLLNSIKCEVEKNKESPKSMVIINITWRKI